MRDCGGTVGLLLTQYDPPRALVSPYSSSGVKLRLRAVTPIGHDSLQFSIAMFVQAGWHLFTPIRVLSIGSARP